MLGCHEARNAVSILEIFCPQCAEVMEIFVKDGALCADSQCGECGHVVEALTPLGELECV